MTPRDVDDLYDAPPQPWRIVATVALGIVVGLGLLWMLSGCTSALATARQTTATIGDLVDKAEPVLAFVDQGQQVACLEASPTDDAAAKSCVARVRAAFSPAWRAYRRVRAAWLAAAAAVEAAETADRAGREPDMLAVASALEALRQAETAFAQAAAAVEGGAR